MNIENTKQQLLTECIDILKRPKEIPEQAALPPIDPFALYVSNQLEGLDGRGRLAAEKRINDVLSDLHCEEISFRNLSSFVPNQTPQTPTFMPGSYTAMLST